MLRPRFKSGFGSALAVTQKKRHCLSIRQCPCRRPDLSFRFVRFSLPHSARPNATTKVQVRLRSYFGFNAKKRHCLSIRQCPCRRPDLSFRFDRFQLSRFSLPHSARPNATTKVQVRLRSYFGFNAKKKALPFY